MFEAAVGSDEVHALPEHERVSACTVRIHKLEHERDALRAQWLGHESVVLDRVIFTFPCGSL